LTQQQVKDVIDSIVSEKYKRKWLRAIMDKTSAKKGDKVYRFAEVIFDLLKPIGSYDKFQAFEDVDDQLNPGDDKKEFTDSDIESYFKLFIDIGALLLIQKKLTETLYLPAHVGSNIKFVDVKEQIEEEEEEEEQQIESTYPVNTKFQLFDPILDLKVDDLIQWFRDVLPHKEQKMPIEDLIHKASKEIILWLRKAQLDSPNFFKQLGVKYDEHEHKVIIKEQKQKKKLNRAEKSVGLSKTKRKRKTDKPKEIEKSHIRYQMVFTKDQKDKLSYDAVLSSRHNDENKKAFWYLAICILSRSMSKYVRSTETLAMKDVVSDDEAALFSSTPFIQFTQPTVYEPFKPDWQQEYPSKVYRLTHSKRDQVNKYIQYRITQLQTPTKVVVDEKKHAKVVERSRTQKKRKGGERKEKEAPIDKKQKKAEEKKVVTAIEEVFKTNDEIDAIERETEKVLKLQKDRKEHRMREMAKDALEKQRRDDEEVERRKAWEIKDRFENPSNYDRTGRHAPSSSSSSSSREWVPNPDNIPGKEIKQAAILSFIPGIDQPEAIQALKDSFLDSSQSQSETESVTDPTERTNCHTKWIPMRSCEIPKQTESPLSTIKSDNIQAHVCKCDQNELPVQCKCECVRMFDLYGASSVDYQWFCNCGCIVKNREHMSTFAY